MYLFDKPFTRDEKYQLIDTIKAQLKELCNSKDKNEILLLVSSIMDKLSLLGRHRCLEIDIQEKEQEFEDYGY